MNRKTGKRSARNSLFIVAVIASLLVCSASFAAFKNSAGVHAFFNMGGVNIEVENYRAYDGEEVLEKEEMTLDYYGSASFIPRITNKAESCYVRVKLTAQTDLQQIDIMKNLYGIGEGWTLIGGYLYYKQPVESKESIDVCRGFDVPAEWDYKSSNSMKIKVAADAVQSKNFTPDFSSDNPWGDVTVSESKVKDDYIVNTVRKSQGSGNIRVVCENKPEGVTINTDGFFSDVIFMPGDEYEDILRISNNTAEKATVLFKESYEKSKLLDAIQLSINNGSIFYDGPLTDESLKGYRAIAVLDPWESVAVNMKVKVPESVDNEQQLKEEIVTWYFAIEQEQDNVVKTGDDISLWLLAALCFAGGAAAVVIWKRKSGLNEKGI